MLACCLRDGGQAQAAEKRFREALSIIETLLKKEPEAQNRLYIGQRGAILTGLGDTLSDQGKYQQAQKAYEEAMNVDKQTGYLQGQAVDQGHLGTLAIKQRDYAKAELHFKQALGLFQSLKEPQMEAASWHQLGRVAEEQEEWVRAEQYYRESLRIKEQLGDAAGAARTCNQLAIVARRSGRPGEAEGWNKRALELDELVQAGSPSNASHLNNLADLLVNEVQASRMPKSRLIEARSYTERALTIKETLEASSEIWTTLGILATIADLEGRTEDARNYRRRGCETFAAFEGNRYHIDRQHGQLIAAIAAAAKGDVQAREAVEAALPGLEEKRWKIADAVHRIWAGELAYTSGRFG
jgi:tetratricopeptide (TPR) repeat protein